MNKNEYVTKNNIFEDLGFTKVEAINLKARSELMIALRKFIEKNKLTQKRYT